ncbi:hypothetical protein NP233_g10674 [Leucocoprinus birnbaumii]|uniref:glutathione transferase n=1 Tax=Leucocoprinus birnbaumii TaxID=56174 RepID=A0AAD5YRP1_9AGAR|nr:hypothetical protein NP233_g10674 [Leucocoprinus birnbaumii]
MVLKLYGFFGSTCTKRVATVLHEKNIPFQFINVDLSKAEHKAADFKAKQPFGQVPYIDDEGFTLYESRAICRYLDAKYTTGTKLVPQDLKARALFEQAASIEQSNFDSIAAPLAWEKVIKKRYGQEPDEARVTELTGRLAQKLDAYEQILSKQKYLAGDELTLADLFHLPYGALLGVAGINLIQERPHVAKWFNELSSRPSWQAVKEKVEGTA